MLANENDAHLPKVKIIGTARLRLLRRTLRERPALARMVRELNLSDLQSLHDKARIEREEIVNLVASLVMAAPYLERLVGFHIPYSASFDRLSHALSTRPSLEERLWLVRELEYDTKNADEEEDSKYYHPACDPTERFLELNSRYLALSTLVLHQNKDRPATFLNFRAVVGTLRMFPKLRNLTVSGFSSASFTSLTLNSLPAGLESLRLESLPGISDRSIQRFVSSRLATSIRKLLLINLDIQDLYTIANILSYRLDRLESLSLVQEKAPNATGGMTIPDLYSPSLRYIHWELRSEAGPTPTLPSLTTPDPSEQPSFPFTNAEPICCLATSLLSTGIRTGAFPSLRKVRIPHDPQGVMQALCRPLAAALLPCDASYLAVAPRISSSDGFSIVFEDHAPLVPKIDGFSAITISANPRADSAVSSPTLQPLSPVRSRLAAQSRILAAKKDAFITVRVFDPQGEVQINRVIGGHIGRLDSPISYVLRADPGCDTGDARGKGWEQCEWITGISDLVSDCGVESSRVPQSQRGSCGHLVGRRFGKRAVVVDDLF